MQANIATRDDTRKMIQFTRRELERAWRSATVAACFSHRTNAHRLLLFYAIECGLKAVHLKRKNINLLDSVTASIFKHDLNRILDHANVAKALRLPDQLSLPALKSPSTPRHCKVGELNQVWRYGGCLEPPFDDYHVEIRLEEIHKWIQKELQ